MCVLCIEVGEACAETVVRLGILERGMIEVCAAIAGVGRVTWDRLIKDDVCVKMRFESALCSCK